MNIVSSNTIERELIERGHYLDDLYYITMFAVHRFEELYADVNEEQKQLCNNCEEESCAECVEFDELDSKMGELNEALEGLMKLVDNIDYKD